MSPDLIGTPVRRSMLVKRGITAIRRKWLVDHGTMEGCPIEKY